MTKSKRDFSASSTCLIISMAFDVGEERVIWMMFFFEKVRYAAAKISFYSPKCALDCPRAH